MASEASSEQIYRRIATAVDSAFYRAIYSDVAQARIDPVTHYAHDGWLEGRDPAPWFSTNAYLEANPDVVGVNPLFHYLTAGWREGRTTAPSNRKIAYLRKMANQGLQADWQAEPSLAQAFTAPLGGDLNQSGSQACIAVAAAFDSRFYRSLYSDVDGDDEALLEHFLAVGWKEGRDPSSRFSVRDYLELNPDIAAAQINPFVHFVLTGQAEGRLGRSNLDFRHQVIARLTPMGDRLEVAKDRSRSFSAQNIRVLAAAVAKVRSKAGSVHISVSHDDFTANVGGVQLCLQREAVALEARHVDHLHLYPVAAWPTLRPSDWSTSIGVVWNGLDLGAFTANDLVQVLKGRHWGRSSSFAIHSLLGHSVEEILSILGAVGLSKGFFWLHDFTSLCAGFHLMRNDVADCGAPPIDSAACGVCIYQPHRSAHVDSHNLLFAALDLTVVAPSSTTYETWRAATTAPLNQPYVIHPHATLTRRASRPKSEAGVLKVAFLGMPAAHKGWPAFADLAIRFSDDPRYQFLHLGSVQVKNVPAIFHRVSVTASEPLAMRDCLLNLNVDVAVIWSLCRETFSFAAHEAAAAGALILTGPDSGNVAAFVAETALGVVLGGEAELMALFADGAAPAMARSIRNPATYDLAFSALTVDLLERQ